VAREVRKKEWRYPASNGEGNIFARAWLPPLEAPPQAIVQIAHGMSEHSGRYDEFARALCGQGFIVVANDHAGHGLSAQGHLGSFAKTPGGFDCIVKDMHHLFNWSKKAEQLSQLSLPNVLIGQSMGSLAAALYAEQYDNLSALVLSATPSAIKFSRLFELLATVIATTHGQLAHSPLLEKLTGSIKGMSDEEMLEARSWLNRNKDEIRALGNDPLCGFDYSAGGYQALLKAYHHVNAKSWGSRIPNIPILIVAGSDDSSTGFGAGPLKRTKRLAKTGHTQVELRLFKDARHELIKELNKQEVFSFIGTWIRQQVTSST